MADKNTLTIVFRNDTEERWCSNNPVLLRGEIVASLKGDDTLFKIGNGVDHYRDLREVDLYTALKDGCMYTPTGTTFQWGKIKFKFLNNHLQDEVDAGEGMVLDLSKIDTLFV